MTELAFFDEMSKIALKKAIFAIFSHRLRGARLFICYLTLIFKVSRDKEKHFFLTHRQQVQKSKKRFYFILIFKIQVYFFSFQILIKSAKNEEILLTIAEN